MSLAIYRVTDKLPVGEALVNQLRGIANKIVGYIAEGEFVLARKKIEVILNYFQIARLQNWLKEINWLILIREYRFLTWSLTMAEKAESSLEMETEIKNKSENIVSHNMENNEIGVSLESSQKERSQWRRNRIIAEIQKKQALKLSDLIPLFSKDVSDRTLRNDLKGLLRQKAIQKRGFNKTAVYVLR